MAVDDVRNLRPNFSMWLRSPILAGANPRIEMSQFTEDFDARIADDGSDYLNFKVTTEFQSLNNIIDWFETSIAGDMRVVTDTNEVIWRGMLKAMILSAGGDAEIRDLELLANEAIVEHTGGTSGTITSSGSADSAAYFGRKLIKISDTSDLSLADATRVADQYLAINSWSRARPYAGDDRSEIQFQFIGYLYMLDWLEDSITPPLTVKAAIEQVITNTGQGIINFTPDSIQDNGQMWTSAISGTGLELIRKLTNMLDSSGDVWRFYIDTNNVAHFEPVEFTPYYYRRVSEFRQNNGLFTAAAGGSQKSRLYTAKAGVIVRNLAYPIQLNEVGSPFISRQDRYIEAIRFNKNGEFTVESQKRYPEVWAQSEQYQESNGDF